MDNKSHIIHVGLGKAASTFLQCNYFNSIFNYQYETTCAQAGSVSEELSWIRSINSYHDIIKKNKIEKRVYCNPISNIKLRTVMAMSKVYVDSLSKPMLFSSEGLVGVSYSPCRNNLEIALLLSKIFDSCKIILIIRKQDDYCESVYRQLVFKENRFGFYLSFDDFYSYKPSIESVVYTGELNWLTLLNNYNSIFGEKNVLCLPYEFLVQSPAGFINSITEFVGEDPELSRDFWSKRDNTSPAKSVYTKKRSIFRDKRKIEFQGIGIKKKAKIIDTCKKANELLSNAINMDLSRYGYHDM